MNSRKMNSRTLLALAVVAVAFAAADTYVVVLALPDMMAGVGISPEELQRGAPIVSGFLLGYVAMLPLIGRIADVHGRVPVLVASLAIFVVGSAVTTLSYDLSSMVFGRFLQGLGGGGLVPATLALVADLYPADRRGIPLGLVSAVQEIGSVLGPVFGALVLVALDWRGIFAVNALVGLVLFFAVRRAAPSAAFAGAPPGAGALSPVRLPRDWWHWAAWALALVGVLTAGSVMVQPPSLMADLTWGRLFIPVFGSGRWLTPLGLTSAVAVVGFVACCLVSARPVVDLRAWGRSLAEADLVGAIFGAVALGGIVLAFATADPRVEVFSGQGLWYLVGAGVGAVAFVVHIRRASDPLLPVDALKARAAWGAVAVSFVMGASLVAALVDIPLFARSTVYGDSQVLASLVLVRFLIALPVGAVAGGYLIRRLSPGVVVALGMVLAAAGFLWMAQWDLDSLRSWLATVPLVVGGFGFGLALAPINASILANTAAAVHGVTSSLVVVARMVGMLVGISALSTLGLRAYYRSQADMPGLAQTCGGTIEDGWCDAYQDLIQQASITQEHTIFLGAALLALVAAILAVLTLRNPQLTNR
ncbi:MAG: MFS transporter [Nocardioides sp.]